MKTDRRDRISDLYHAALERAPEERSAFVKAACDGDEVLRQEVESLLAYESASGRFLERPAAAVVASVAARADLVGRQLGPYTVAASLGVGGMGEVYRAHDPKLGRDVAIKVLPPEFTSDPERRARLTREARLLATLNHPHIGAIYGLEEAESQRALVLELVEGPTLADRLERGPLAIADALALARQIAEALEAAHDKGIVHRDLKPANIVLQESSGVPRVKVLDFGLAKAMTPGTDVLTSNSFDGTADGRVVGTPAYMSPEQARGLPVDDRTDIWAFGCVLYQMLTGRQAFDGATATDTLAHVLEREPDWSALPATSPAAIRTLLRRCLEKESRNRLHAMADARIDIEEQLAGFALINARRRGRRWRAITTAGAVVVAAWAVWTLWPAKQVGPATSPAPIPLTVDPAHRVAVLLFSYHGGEAHAYLRQGMVNLLSRTLDDAGSLRTVDPRAVLGLLAQHGRTAAEADGANGLQGTSLAAARAVADGLDVRRFVVGDIVEAGGRLRIGARLYRTDPSTEPVSGAVEGLPVELFRLVDELTAQLAAGGADPGTQLGRTAARTTTSLEALKAFLQGEHFFRGPNSQRMAAYAAYQRAVDLDASFAIAWYRLSQLAYFSGAASSRLPDLAETAVRHGASLPWRTRRLLEAHWAFARGAAGESERAYREILQTYPADVDALFGAAVLGTHYNWLLGGPPTWYRQPREAFLRFEPDDFMGLWMLRNAEAQDGNCAAAHSLNRRMFPREIPPAHHAVAVFCGPSSEEQEELLRTARHWPIAEVRVSRLWVNWISRNPRGAAAFARLVEWDENPQHRAISHLMLAELELAQGRAEAARQQFARLASINPAWALADNAYRSLAAHHSVDAEQLRGLRKSLQSWDAGVVAPWSRGGPLREARHDGLHLHLRSYLLGRINAKLGDYGTAERHATELEQMGSSKNTGSVARDLAQSIRAHVFAEQGRLEGALRALEAASREVPFDKREGSWAFVQPQERFLRAELLDRLGRSEEALRWYQSVHYWPESVLAGPSHLRQGEIHERLGRREQAIEQYHRFVDLWRDCDPEFRPLVDQTRAALRRLGTD